MRKKLIIIILNLFIFSKEVFSNEYPECNGFSILLTDIAQNMQNIKINNMSFAYQIAKYSKAENTKTNQQKIDNISKLLPLNYVNMFDTECLKYSLEYASELSFNNISEKRNFIFRTYSKCILCINSLVFEMIWTSM